MCKLTKEEEYSIISRTMTNIRCNIPANSY